MSTLQVENLIGPTSGANANKVIIPSGQTLDASNGFVAPAGSVIQVVNTNFDTLQTFSSASSVDTGLFLSITPKFASSKILVNFNAHLSGNGVSQGFIQLRRGDGTLLGPDEIFFGRVGDVYVMNGYQKFDSPNTTSTVTYKIKIRATVSMIALNQDGGVSDVTLMEIAQ